MNHFVSIVFSKKVVKHGYNARELYTIDGEKFMLKFKGTIVKNAVNTLKLNS